MDLTFMQRGRLAPAARGLRAPVALAAVLLSGATSAAMAAEPAINRIAGQFKVACSAAPCGDGGPAIDANLYTPSGMGVDPSGDVYIAEFSNHAIRRIDLATGQISTFAGSQRTSCTATPCGDGGPATDALLNGPRGIAADSAGNIYIADFSNHAIRRVDATTGIISTVAGTLKASCLAAPCGDGGVATDAALNSPTGVAFDEDRRAMYIADYGNHVIRRVDLDSNVITTIAGTMKSSCSLAPCGDGGAATSAQFNGPSRLAVDSSGDLFVTEYGNHSVRRIDIDTGLISTVAGTQRTSCSVSPCGDGGLATAARLTSPFSLTVDQDDNLLIADSSNGAIRKVDMQSGLITTVAGIVKSPCSSAPCGDGGAATSAQLSNPFDVAALADGAFYVLEYSNQVLRKVEAAAASVPQAPTIGTASAGDGSATVTFSVPSDGGSPITGYTATSTPDALTGTCASSPCTVNGLSNSVSYTFTVHASNAVGDSDPSAASNAVVPKAVQASLTVTASPSTIAFGETGELATDGGSGTGAVSYAITSGGEYCSLDGSALTGTAVGACVVTATKAGDASHVAATATVSVTVVKAAQSGLTVAATPQAIRIGQTSALSASGGSGIGAIAYSLSDGESNCSIDGATLTGVAVGDCTVLATRAGDANYLDATSSVTVSVSLATQATLELTVTPSSIVVGESAALSTAGGSGTGAVSHAITVGDAICSIDGSTLNALGAGICTVTATKAGDGTYDVATDTAVVSVGKAEQAALAISASPSAIVFGDSSTLSTSGGSGSGAVSYAVTAGASVCTLAGSTLTATGVGDCTVTATRDADDNYNAATASTVVSVGKAEQAALAVSASPSAIVFGSSSTLSTSGGSGIGAVSYAVTAGASICTLAGSTLTATGVGDCTVTATRAADDNYNAATASTVVSVGKAEQAALTIAAMPGSVAIGQTSTLSTSGGSGNGAVSLMLTAGAASCALSGAELTGTATGDCTVTATKAEDAHYLAATATVVVSVGKAEQAALTVSASPSAIVFGDSSTLSTSGGSGSGAVSYAVTAGASICTLDGSTLTATGVGDCTVTATRDADDNYNAATASTVVSVGKAEQAQLLATASPAAIGVGATSTLATTGGSGSGPVEYTVDSGAASCGIEGNTLTGLAAGECTVTATRAADAFHHPATASVVVSVVRAAQAPLTVIATPAGFDVGQSATLSTEGGSGTGAVSYALTAGGSFCALNGHTLSGLGGGDCTVTATKAADAAHDAATGFVIVSVGKAQAELVIHADSQAPQVGDTIPLATSGGSGNGAVTFTVVEGAESCRVEGDQLIIIGTGSCTVRADKESDGEFRASSTILVLGIPSVTWTITPAVGAGGSISPSGPRTVAEGDSIAFTITPHPGFRIDSASGCGGVLAGDSYVTAAIVGDCTVSVSFAPALAFATPAVIPATDRWAALLLAMLLAMAAPEMLRRRG